MKTGWGKLSVMLGVLAMGLSPSFIDWQQEPDKRAQIVSYYIASLALVGLGLWDG